MILKKIDALFERYTSPGSPGCVLGVIVDGGLAVKQAYGLANIELTAPITTQTTFNIGSMAKQFTGFAVALLEAENKLSLDDDIRTHLPKMADTGHTVTIRHLVHHTSGVRDSFPDLLSLAGWRDTDMTTTDDVLKLLESQKYLNFTPGEEYVYCNSNYVLMAEIVKQVSGMPFSNFCKTRLFEPLGMNNTVVNDNVYMNIKKRAASYYEDGENWLYAPLTDSVVGPTNVYTNIEDLAKWDKNFYSKQVGGKAVIERVHEPGKLNNGKLLDYAFGLMVGPEHTYKGWQLVEHGGSQAGYSSWMLRVSEKNLSVVVLFNYFMWGMREYAIKVLDLFLEKKSGVSQKLIEVTDRTPITLETSQMDQWTGVYFHPIQATIRQISIKDEKLMFRENPLAPISESRFYFTEMPEYEVHFNKKTMTILGDAEDVIYDKVDTTNLASTDLKVYEGRFFSQEIGQHWTITASEDSLTVSRWKYPKTQMTPLFLDAFNDDWMPIMGYPTNFTVVFTRNKEGRIQGFKVSGNGVRHLWFECE